MAQADPWAGFESVHDPWAEAGFLPANVSSDNIDKRTGAPYGVRAVAGSMPEQISPGAGPDLKLDALRKFYPDAKPTGDGNYVFTNPQTGKRQLYNPEGFDTGDIASLLPQIGEFVGGAAGAIGGGAAGALGGPLLSLGGAMVGAGAGATIGREAVERGAMALSDVPDRRGLAEQALNAMQTAGWNAAGEGIGAATGPMLHAATQAMLSRGGREGVERAVNDLEQFGVTPSLAQATSRRSIDTIESFAAKVPGPAGVIRAAAEGQSEKVAASMAEKAAALNRGVAPSSLTAGAAAVEGVESFHMHFMDKADVLYGKLDSFLPANAPVAASNTQRILNEIGAPIAGADEFSAPLVNPALAKMRAGLEADTQGSVGAAGGSAGGRIPYEAMSEMRSLVGRKLGSPQIHSDLPRADLKAVYSAMSDDLRIAAQAQGPAAAQAFDRANAYYKAGIERIDKMLEPLVRNKLPEQVFAAIEQSAKQGPTRLQALRKSVSAEQWRAIAATATDRLGRAKAGSQGVEAETFSFQNFLSNWQKLSPDTRDILFGGPNMGSIKSDLDGLARASERIRTSSQAFANPSGTAGVGIGGAMLFGAGASLVSGDPTYLLAIGGAMAGGNYLASKLLVNPKFVKWLARAPEVKPGGIAAHLGRLPAIAMNSDSDSRDAIMELLGNLQVHEMPQFPGGGP